MNVKHLNALQLKSDLFLSFFLQTVLYKSLLGGTSFGSGLWLKDIVVVNVYNCKCRDMDSATYQIGVSVCECVYMVKDTCKTDM